jgi:hypothetical protein
VDEGAEGQLRVIRKVIAATEAADIPAWLFGGWGLDARIGRITREHGDVEFWVERIHAERSKAVLVEAGATALMTQPPEEACEFRWDDTPFSTAYFDRQPDGSFSQPLGRWSDWLFPPRKISDVWKHAALAKCSSSLPASPRAAPESASTTQQGDQPRDALALPCCHGLSRAPSSSTVSQISSTPAVTSRTQLPTWVSAALAIRTTPVVNGNTERKISGHFLGRSPVGPDPVRLALRCLTISAKPHIPQITPAQPTTTWKADIATPAPATWPQPIEPWGRALVNQPM